MRSTDHLIPAPSFTACRIAHPPHSNLALLWFVEVLCRARIIHERFYGNHRYADATGPATGCRWPGGQARHS